MKKVLTIAGSDTSGGAGIQADLKTFQELNVYGISVLTVIVAMNPHNNWGHQVFPVDTEIIKAQIETIAAGIGINAMKTGLLPTAEIIELVAHTIKKHNIQNAIIDPVMVCKGTGEPVNPGNTECFKKYLVPIAAVVTPNIFEASQLSGIKNIETVEDMKEAACVIKELGAKYVVIKGKNNGMAVDILYDGKTFNLFEAEKINTTYTHGAGCTFSAAIAAGIAHGYETDEAVKFAKDFTARAIKHSFKLNQYVGTLNRRGFANG